MPIIVATTDGVSQIILTGRAVERSPGDGDCDAGPLLPLPGAWVRSIYHPLDRMRANASLSWADAH